MTRNIVKNPSSESVPHGDIAPSGAPAAIARQEIIGRIGPALGERRRQIRTHREAPRQQQDRITEVNSCVVVAIEGIETGDAAPAHEEKVKSDDGIGERLDGSIAIRVAPDKLQAGYERHDPVQYVGVSRLGRSRNIHHHEIFHRWVAHLQGEERRCLTIQIAGEGC